MEAIRIWILDIRLQNNDSYTTIYEADESMSRKDVMKSIRDEMNKNFIIVGNKLINVSAIKQIAINLEEK